MTTFDKEKPLNTLPHYSDPRFKDGEQTVFGKAEEGLLYDYSDRIADWDRKKATFAAHTANASGMPPKSCLWYEAYLSAFFGKPVEVRHIVAGVNLSNGYPYWVCGYRDKSLNEIDRQS